MEFNLFNLFLDTNNSNIEKKSNYYVGFVRKYNNKYFFRAYGFSISINLFLVSLWSIK